MKRRNFPRKSTLMAALLVTGTGFLPATPVELLTNGSFELPVEAQFGTTLTDWSIGPPEGAAVNYPWLQSIWSLNGPNPDGNQIAVMNGNTQQTVGIVEADKFYTFSFWVYFRSNQHFYADLTTDPWASGLYRSFNDTGTSTIQNLPDPIPIGEWFQVTGTLNTSLPAFSSAVGQTLYVHFWTTGTPNEILLDDVSLTISDPPPPPTYYVSFSEGSDSNDGLTPDTPFQTFAPVNNQILGPGSAVYLRRGDTWANSQLILEGKGSVDEPIILGAYGEGPNPIITGINTTTAAAVIINNGSNWDINSLDLRDAKVGLYLRYTGGNTDGTGAMFNNENMTISHCNFQGMNEEWSDINGQITVVSPFELSWGAGIWIGGSVPAPPGGPWASVTTTVLDGLTIRHSSFQNVSTGVGNGWYFPGAYKQRMRNIILEDSWVTGCENGSFALFSASDVTIRRFDTWLGGNGFYASGTTAGFLQDTDNVLIENSEFAFNKRNNTGNDGTGMDFEGNSSNTIFRHNVMHNNDGAGILILPTNGNNTNLQMTSNTQWNNARNPKDSGQNKELTASNNSHSGSFSNNGVYLGADVLTGLEVYNNTTRWNNLFSANTGGNRIATPWSAVSGRPTGWTFAASVEGWGNENDVAGLAASGGALVGTSTGIDPYVLSPATWVNTRERRWVLVRMSQTAGDTGQIFFQTETDATWTAEKSVTFPIVADGTMRTYFVSLDEVDEYRGVVTQWRLDPTNASGSTMAIDEFSARLDPHLQSVTVLGYDELEIAFNQAMLPQSGLFDPSNYTISGAGAGWLAANPDTVTQIPTANGPVYRLKWNSGATNGDPATLTINNVQAARGHAITVGNTATFTTDAGPSRIENWQFY